MESIGEFEYHKKDLIGHGAFAVVFKGHNKRRPDYIVAIKCITKKNLSKSQNLLSKEIKILKELSSLQHENVVALLDCKETPHSVYLVMEYCNGGDLADYLQAKGTLSEDTISSFLRQIAGAMKALNAKGIVHRDLKPQNILLCHTGQPSHSPHEMKLKIADFGFARFLHDGVMAATLCGSPMYMAPEVIMSLQYDAKADLWSVGTIVYQCLTGKAPFQAQTPQQLKQFYERNEFLAPVIPNSTSPELKDLLIKLLKRNAKNRIEFDDFFQHPFFNPKPPKSSPVPVPRTRSTSSASDSPTMKEVSASPLSGFMPQSPPPNNAPIMRRNRNSVAEPMDQGSTSSGAGFAMAHGDGRSSPSSEGFVLVPDNVPSDASDGSFNRPPSSVDLNAIFSDNSPDSPKLTRSPRKTSQEVPRQQSPSRPSTLPVMSSPGSSPSHGGPMSSQPIPVPSQVKAYQQIQKSSPSSPLQFKHTPSPSQDCLFQGVAIPTSRARKLSGTSVGSGSPPNGNFVQFTIGTPPNTVVRKSSTATPPTQFQRNTPPNNSPIKKTGPSSLPTIMGSPSKLARGLPSPPTLTEHWDSPTSPLCIPFGHRTRTCPDNISAVGFQHDNRNPLFSPEKSNPSLHSFNRSSSANKLSEQLYRAYVGGGSGFQFGGSNPNMRESDYSSSGFYPGSERAVSCPEKRKCQFGEGSPLGKNLAKSPPNMEGPVCFTAPALREETLMDREHNETVAKLNFVLALVECIVELAQSRSSPISESVTEKPGFTLDHFSFVSESQRCMEQLVLYVRALQLLSTSMELARDETKGGRLQSSKNVKLILKDMKNYYSQCLKICRHLHSKGLVQVSDLQTHSASITADKLIYNYAIEMCQTAALDEIFGNSRDECFRRYRSAQILLHSLSQQAHDLKDRELLEKYKGQVERRLVYLDRHAYHTALDNS